MTTGSHKKRGTTGRLTRDGELSFPVRSFKDPPPLLSEIISSDLDESQPKTRISTVWRKIGIPVFLTTATAEKDGQMYDAKTKESDYNRDANGSQKNVELRFVVNLVSVAHIPQREQYPTIPQRGQERG